MIKLMLIGLLASSAAAVNAGDLSVRVRGGYFDSHYYHDSGRHFRTYDPAYPVYGYRFYRSPYLSGSHYYGDRYSKYYGYPRYRDGYSRKGHHRLGPRRGHRHRQSLRHGHSHR
jgi:hypothetical protein